MTPASLGTSLRQVLNRIAGSPGGDLADGELLGRFAAARDEAAFTALVERHGPMVLGVCRRLLHDGHDAEDAFQATFLVLARKAASLDRGGSLGNWLYTVARNLALKARGSAAARRIREKEATMPANEPRDEATWNDVCGVLDAELGRLPDRYRAPLVLCYLEGKTHEAAARELGWPAGSMAKRLTRGLELMRERLAGRGVALSAAALGGLVAKNSAAAVPGPLVAQLSKAAVFHAGGQSMAGLVSAQAAGLAGQAARAMTVAKYKAAAAAVVLGLTLLGAGAGVLAFRAAPKQVGAALKQEADAPKLPSKPVAEDLRDRAVRALLNKPVNLVKGIDGNTPLKDALEFLGERYDVKFRIDEEAFAAAGLETVEEEPVSLPKMVGIRLGAVLRLLMQQVEPHDGTVTGYRIQDGVVVIAPAPLASSVEEEAVAEVYRRLFAPVALPDGLPKGLTLAEGLQHVEKAFGQKLILDRKAFAEVGERAIEKYPLAGRGRLLPDDPTLAEVLDLILWQVDGDSWKSYYRVRSGTIEITAAKHDSAQAKALEEHQEELKEHQARLTKAANLERTLRGPVELDKGITENTPLMDALEFFSDRSGVPIIMDSQAFAAVGMPKVHEHFVQLEPQKKAIPLEKALRLLLDQIKGDSYGATLVRREGYVEIAPEHQQLRKQQPLEAQHLDKLWADLGGASGLCANLAVQTLVRAPKDAVPYLKEHVKPATPPDPNRAARVKKTIADLESNQFAVRQKATEELEKHGFDALPALRERLGNQPSLEVRKRIEQILKKLTPSPARAEELRGLRAVHVLEEIGTAEARQVLETLAKGEPHTDQTEAARAAVGRLRK